MSCLKVQFLRAFLQIRLAMTVVRTILDHSEHRGYRVIGVCPCFFWFPVLCCVKLICNNISLAKNCCGIPNIQIKIHISATRLTRIRKGSQRQKTKVQIQLRVCTQFQHLGLHFFYGITVRSVIFHSCTQLRRASVQRHAGDSAEYLTVPANQIS
jgi:hypothetical protein